MNTNLRVGFALRCFQRLSEPNFATQRCPWQDNWYTRGLSVPGPLVLGKGLVSIRCV